MTELIAILCLALALDFLFRLFRPLRSGMLAPEEIAAIPGKVNAADFWPVKGERNE